MAGCVMSGTTASLQLVKARVIHDVKRFNWGSDNRRVKGSSQSMRLVMYYDGERSSRFNSTMKRRQGAPKPLEDVSTLEEAVANLTDRVNRGIAVNSYEYTHILQWCSKQKDLEAVKQVHECIKISEMEQNLFAVNNLLKCYLGCGRWQTAQEIFNKASKKNTVTWNIMIRGCAEHEQFEGAIEAYKQMRNEGVQPDAITYVNALKACASPTALKWGKDIHHHILRDGLQADVRVGTSLVLMYAHCDSIEDSRAVFSRLEKRDVFCWNVMIGGLAQNGLGQEAFSLFLQMQREGFTPNLFTFINILNPCSSTGDVKWVKEVHAHATRAGLDVDVRVGTALVRMYAKSGNIEDARAVFNRLRKHDLLSWTVIIGGLADHGLGREAFSLFLEMQREGFTPDVITYLSILSPCSSLGAVEWVKEVHLQAMKAGLDVDMRVGTALVQIYARSGNIDEARAVFDKMERLDVMSWTVMIGGLAQHGLGHGALQLFEKMKLKGVEPNVVLFVAVLSACSHAGLVDEGRLLFLSMMRDHGIEPVLEHYNCMVDMFGRAGHLEEAKLFILNMPIAPNMVTWKAFLGACRTHKNIKLAELAAEECMHIEPTDASPYVLLSNLYAAVGQWHQVAFLRNMMVERGIRKDPGLCWIEVDDKVNHFFGGDTSHPQIKETYAMLSSLFEKMKAEGYMADTRLVLRNVAEEDKESAVCSHSEKLAVAYGLMHVPHGKPIRVYKNLRICTDCHAATKIISKITGREIVARDVNRFHHFKEGSCSCGDYW